MTGTVNQQLVLASRSPRRVELMRDAGYVFLVDPADIDEDAAPTDLTPTQLAELLAVSKAKAVAIRHPDAVVIGCDTVVFARGEFLAKPTDANDARRMMRLLSNTVHDVVTGVALVHHASQRQLASSETSHIHFREISAAEIEAHIKSDNWQGKAGGYGLQHNDPFVTRVEGDPTNVVGLPMGLLARLFAQFDQNK